MNEIVTQRSIRQELASQVGLFPLKARPYMHEALSQVAETWNAATCDEPFSKHCETLLRRRLCEMAQAALVAHALEGSEAERLARSAARANLGALVLMHK